MDFNSSTAESTIVTTPGVINAVTPGIPTLTDIFDVRAYASYYFEVIPTVIGIPSNFNSLVVDFLWYADAAGTQLVFQDSAEFWAQSPAPFVFTNADSFKQDCHHGPFFRIRMNTGFGAESIAANWTLVQSTRLIPVPYTRQGGGIDGTLLDIEFQVIGGGGVIDTPCWYGHGRALLQISSSVAMSIQLWWGGVQRETFVTVGGAAPVRFELVLPKRAVYAHSINITGGAGTYTMHLTSQYDKS